MILFCVNIQESKKLKDTKWLIEREEETARIIADKYKKKQIEYENKVSRNKELDEEYSEKQKILKEHLDNLSELHSEKAKNLQIF